MWRRWRWAKERVLPPLTTLTQQVAAVVLFPFVKNNRVSRGTPPPPGLSPRSCPPQHDHGKEQGRRCSILRAGSGSSPGQSEGNHRGWEQSHRTGGLGSVQRHRVGSRCFCSCLQDGAPAPAQCPPHSVLARPCMGAPGHQQHRALQQQQALSSRPWSARRRLPSSAACGGFIFFFFFSFFSFFF